jgi:hypothetical protein
MATELGNLGTDLNGYTDNYASAINAGGTIVGSVAVFDGSGYHAVYWGADGAAINLNTLIDPSSGWRLKYAQDISDTGWIEGVGIFDPDGSGAHIAYSRHFLIHVPAAAALPGDYNNNGTVDAADYVVWRKTDGSAAGYNAWRAHFGQTAGSGAGDNANAVVPEPTTLVILIVAAFGIRLRRRQIAC